MIKNTNMKNPKGVVYLVGAGPGDPGLITLRGGSWLQAADAVVYDGLVSPALLEIATHAEQFYVGKIAGMKGKKCIKQEKINQLLVKLARQGKKVVRLKGGDPFIFGRGGEEASYLKKAGIPFEIVPGVSAGFAAPAYAGIPVTDRRWASSVTFVTAHENPGKKETQADWNSLAKLRGTLVIYMGIQNLKSVTQELIQKGKSASTPASVIEWGTTLRQRVVSGTLKEIAAKAEKAGLNSPAVTVIGEVNRLRKELAWFEKKPLMGKTVLVTRAQSQASTLRNLLESKGASVLEFPVIDILPPKNWAEVDRQIERLSYFDWVVFTSTNGVDYFFRRLQELGKDARIFAGRKIAVIGEATREVLSAHGLNADLVPETYTSEALAEKLKIAGISGRRFLLARTDIAPEFLRKSLQDYGAEVEEMTIYRTVPGAKEARKKRLEEWAGNRKIDYITFTSSSTVKNFFESLTPKLRRQIKGKFISIGPVTSQTLREYGARPYREARAHTIPGIVEAITE